MAEKRKGGRPRQFDPADYLDDLCKSLVDGVPLAEWSRREGNPSPDTVESWMESAPEVERAIARAREFGGDAIAAEALRIADDTTGEPVRDRLRVETRLKLLAKWHPKRYGDLQKVEHSGGVAINVVTGVPEQPK